MPPQKVLVADDHADSVDVYSAMLQHHGYSVVAAHDGVEALRLARLHRPDAVVADVWLPGMDGCALVAEIRSDPLLSPIATLVITADIRPETRARAEAAGCDVYLLKPSDPGELVAAVRDLIGPALSSADVTPSG